MDFTREPIIETIITPKEGCKLVVRSSKGAGIEEYFVDAVEIVAFSHALFFRSQERPKPFIVPVSDYEVLEVKEARVVLKNAGMDRSIKIGGGREGFTKQPREAEKEEESSAFEEVLVKTKQEPTPSIALPESVESRLENTKRDRSRHSRKRKTKDGTEESTKTEEVSKTAPSTVESQKIILPSLEAKEGEKDLSPAATPPSFSVLLQPPPTLISETINRYRQNDLFKGAFYLAEEDQYKPHDQVKELLNEEDNNEALSPSLQEPVFHPVKDESHLSVSENPMILSVESSAIFFSEPPVSSPVHESIPLSHHEENTPTEKLEPIKEEMHIKEETDKLEPSKEEAHPLEPIKEEKSETESPDSSNKE